MMYESNVPLFLKPYAILYAFIINNLTPSAHYKIYNPKTKRISVVHDAHFIETELVGNWYSFHA